MEIGLGKVTRGGTAYPKHDTMEPVEVEGQQWNTQSHQGVKEEHLHTFAVREQWARHVAQ